MDKYFYYLELDEFVLRTQTFEVKEETDTFIKVELPYLENFIEFLEKIIPYKYFEKEKMYKWQCQHNGVSAIYGTDEEKLIKLALNKAKISYKNKIDYLNEERK